MPNQSEEQASVQLNMDARASSRLILAFAALISFSVAAQVPQGAELLTQMASSVRGLDYQGSFVYQHAGRIDTLRVFHAGGPREQERLISLNGPRSELIRSGNNVTCIQADDSAIVYTSTSGRGLLPLVPEAATAGIDDHYAIRLDGSDRVAGYAADIIDVLPRDGFRYGYRLWLEKSTRLLLRSIVTNQKKVPIEQFMFVSLEIGKTPADTDLVPRERELLTTTAAPTDEINLRGPPAWKVLNAPAGFTLRSARRSANAVAGAQHLIYSDGLASVSVYVEPIEAKANLPAALASRGTLNIYSFSKESWRFTILGDVPAATVTAIAESIEPETRAEEP